MNEFQNVMKTVRTMLESTEDKIFVLDFLLEMIGREAVYISSNHLLYLAEKQLPSEYASQFLFPFTDQILRTSKKRVNFDLWGNNIICSPWSLARLNFAIDDIAQNGYIVNPKNMPEGVFYPELKTGIITNNVHHTYVAKAENCGIADMYIEPLEPYFSQITTDGSYWYNNGEKQYKVQNYYMAILYCLAQEKYQLKQNDT